MPRNNNNREIRLRVAEARQRDVGRKIVRISRTDMARLGVVTGDFVEIIGPRGSIIAQVWPAYPEDEDKDIIRMDGYLRRAIGASVGDIVSVKKTSVEPATKVVLAPTEPVRFGPDFVEYVRQFLIRKPISRGEEIVIPIFGMSLKFIVIATQPGYRVYVTDETEIQIRSEPVKEEVIERARMIPKVTWEDIGDLEEAKQKIREIVELPLKHPELFKHLGIEPPKGILLHGPPGTGKTLLAKALANEIGAYFTAINGPEIMSKFYGESEQRLREIFEEAERNAPAIIFIDEIDSIAPKREEVTGEVEKRVVAQLLALMDGLKERGKVIVIGATNRPEALDPALRRPGRFDREIEIPPPDKRARREILAVHTRNMPLEEDVDLDKIAEMTHGYTGADLAALVKEAAMAALRRFIKEGKIDLTQSIPAEKLRDLKVKMADFLEAMKYVQPTLIREIYVEVPEVRWSDIGGLEDVKQQLREAVEWPMKHPEVFEQMGIEAPKGILLFGPPGTGKTLLAKAVATESGANFIAVRGPEILSKWVGESEKAIRQIFRRARQVAPAVVFFDEIDSIAPARGYRHDTSGVTDRIVNQLLTELDGIEPLRKVVVIAATNRPDILDPALLRPGRFDRLIYVPPPDFKARIEIFKVHTKKMPLAPDVDLEELARRTEGYTGADIAAVCREAAILALREEFKVRPVEMKHFLEALKHVPPSLTGSDIERYERMAKELKRMGGLPYRV
ncbi:CDC48 family AAA ATPase [Staphylothermus hellenicus]|uniref:AAA family ATPase, CDC48 subfamily n=1 Tax=Staphylothermus hellenicus (strain DSM 12710 / JCM 10830 / BK20S6-10-b1 / P8) TaxID=591019 RepID=D7D9J0_STAHD|nr:CDC48 family AAA ATPase [Staphylothermus hellenicus]ADI32436.1 AAA family ATPase, CDC48 subfamily [Staphylothermus hellenicus DSM 12710]